jgi:hypothetical protein
MKRNEFIDSLKKKTVRALLDLLRQGQSGKLKIDPDYLENVIEEINNRQLSEKETTEFENLLEFSFEDSSEMEDKKPKKGNVFKESPSEFSNDEIDNLTSGSGSFGRYSALKTIVGLISLLGYIVIVIGIGGLIFLAMNGSALLGFVAVVASVVIALPLLAFSNLIYVFIDIEYNTRKTREALKKNSK